ncbi:MAG: hypothetical protein QOG28_735 [Trebonia sp.]|jgi:hypothetical protein|nr:hypothetical protein [Trebonia sp.]
MVLPATPITVTNAAMPVLGRISPPLSEDALFSGHPRAGDVPVDTESAAVVRKPSSG